MRNTTLREIAFVLLMVIATAVAQELTQAEKDKALQYLESTKANLLEATKGLSKPNGTLNRLPIVGPSLK